MNAIRRLWDWLAPEAQQEGRRRSYHRLILLGGVISAVGIVLLPGRWWLLILVLWAPLLWREVK